MSLGTMAPRTWAGGESTTSTATKHRALCLPLRTPPPPARVTAMGREPCRPGSRPKKYFFALPHPRCLHTRGEVASRWLSLGLTGKKGSFQL